MIMHGCHTFVTLVIRYIGKVIFIFLSYKTLILIKRKKGSDGVSCGKKVRNGKEMTKKRKKSRDIQAYSGGF